VDTFLNALGRTLLSRTAAGTGSTPLLLAAAASGSSALASAGGVSGAALAAAGAVVVVVVVLLLLPAATSSRSAAEAAVCWRGVSKPDDMVKMEPLALLLCDAHARLEPEGPLKHRKPPVLDTKHSLKPEKWGQAT
jgi:hypothetical protein